MAQRNLDNRRFMDELEELLFCIAEARTLIARVNFGLDDDGLTGALLSGRKTRRVTH